MYYVDESGKRVYTLKKIDPDGKPTLSAHPGDDNLTCNRTRYSWGHMLADCVALIVFEPCGFRESDSKLPSMLQK